MNRDIQSTASVTLVAIGIVCGVIFMIACGICLLMTISEYATSYNQMESMGAESYFPGLVGAHLAMGPNLREVLSVLFVILIVPAILAVVCIFGANKKPVRTPPNEEPPVITPPSLPPVSPKKPARDKKDGGFIWYIIKTTFFG